MLTTAVWLMLSSMLCSLHLASAGGSFPKPLTAAEERHYLELAAQGDLAAREVVVPRFVATGQVREDRADVEFRDCFQRVDQREIRNDVPRAASARKQNFFHFSRLLRVSVCFSRIVFYAAHYIAERFLYFAKLSFRPYIL